MNLSWIFLNCVGGILVLSSYFVFLPNVSKNTMWAGIKDPMIQKAYIVSMFISTMAFIIFFFRSKETSYQHIVLAFFFLFSALWAPSLSSESPLLTLFWLTMVSVTGGFLFLMEKDFIAKCALGYLLFHVLVLDNLYWGTLFYLLKTK